MLYNFIKAIILVSFSETLTFNSPKVMQMIFININKCINFYKKFNLALVIWEECTNLSLYDNYCTWHILYLHLFIYYSTFVDTKH